MNAFTATVFATIMTTGQVPLPGTQPNELSLPTEPSSSCSCHDSFTADAFSEPGQSYRATIMALSGRDPLFRAAFEVARKDRPALTDLCLRCHTPSAWLQGRSEGDLDELTPEDLQGVTCDVCHRMVATDPPLVGSGQITLSQSTSKRSRRGNPPFSGHGVTQDDYTASSQMCATCHSLFNPAEQAHDSAGRDLGFVYYEQRTFEEWRDSDFAARGQGCIGCHMKVTRGAAVLGGEVYDDLPVHNFVGGNDFGPRAVRVVNPQLNIALELGQLSRWVEENLAAAAELTVRSAPADVTSGAPFDLEVRLTNKTGHKLPTGYPEGRRVYLEVSIDLEGRAPSVLSGAWDPSTGTLVPDPQLRTYETAHGRVENGRSERVRSLLLMNQIISDTRIPPEGFRPQHPDMIPAGRDYGAMPPYRHYDDHRYTFTGPDVAISTPGILKIRAMHQTTDGEVVNFLVNAAAGTEAATQLANAWEQLGRAPPKEMVAVSVPIVVHPQQMVATDAGIVDTDGGTSDGQSGCRCVKESSASRGIQPTMWLVMLLLLFGWFRAERAQGR